jgi:hypothetical protein
MQLTELRNAKGNMQSTIPKVSPGTEHVSGPFNGSLATIARRAYAKNAGSVISTHSLAAACGQ